MPENPAPSPAHPIRERLLLDAELSAERTVSRLRVAMALVLAGLLFLALAGRPDLPNDVVRLQVAAAVAVLVAYLALGLASLALARPGRLRPWMPWAFTTADAGLILFNIGFNAANLKVSVAFATAFPVVWLAPLILSFTALRYRPGLQAYSGGLLVFGLLVLGWLQGAPPTGGMPPRETFDVPPNLMRLAMFAGCVAVLVVAAQRRRTLLTRAVAEAERRLEYQRYLPPEVADLVGEGNIARLRAGWRVQAAILMVDIRGFTSLAESMDPGEVGRLVGTYRRALGAVVAQHGGVVDKFVGDGAVVLFGVPRASATAPADALACALALKERLAEVDGRRLRLAIGAHWGEVVAGAFGDDERVEFTVLGDAVNVAARLEEVAKIEDRTVVVSQALLVAAGDAAGDGWELLATSHLRGRHDPVTLFASRADLPRSRAQITE